MPRGSTSAAAESASPAHAFSKAARVALPAAEEVDPEPIKAGLEKAADVPELIAATGGGEAPPVAAAPEPVDRYALMRASRKRHREGIPIWRVRDRLEATRVADRDAEDEAVAEEGRRAEAQRAEQARLDKLWTKLGAARDKVDADLATAVAAEKERREAERKAEQAQLDEGASAGCMSDFDAQEPTAPPATPSHRPRKCDPCRLERQMAPTGD